MRHLEKQYTFSVFEYPCVCSMYQGHSQDCFSGGGEAQTKFPVRSQKFLVQSGDIQKNLLNKTF